MEAILNYNFQTLDTPKELGDSKAITENPILKIELTKANAFKVTTFGEYLDIKRKGRTPNATLKKKKLQKMKLDDEDEDAEDSNAIYHEEEDEEKYGKKIKLERNKKMPSTAKDYLGEFSFKSSLDKIAKSMPYKHIAQVTEKKIMEKDLENLEMKEILNKSITDMEEKIICFLLFDSMFIVLYIYPLLLQ